MNSNAAYPAIYSTLVLFFMVNEMFTDLDPLLSLRETELMGYNPLPGKYPSILIAFTRLRWYFLSTVNLLSQPSVGGYSQVVGNPASWC